MSRYASFMQLMAWTGFFLALSLMVEVLWAGGQKAVPQFPSDAQLPKAAGTGTEPQTVRAVLIKDFKYQPSVLIVKVGDTIEWKNADIFPHTVTAVNRSFDSAIINPGHSWKFIVRTAGTLKYLCTLHPNMGAKLIVEQE